MSNVVNLFRFDSMQKVKETERQVEDYVMRLHLMEKLELLEEMVRFQEERSKAGHLTLEMIVKGKALFKKLESNAETAGLRALTGAYYRHLKCELSEFIKNGQITKLEPESF